MNKWIVFILIIDIITYILFSMSIINFLVILFVYSCSPLFMLVAYIENNDDQGSSSKNSNARKIAIRHTIHSK